MYTRESYDDEHMAQLQQEGKLKKPKKAPKEPSKAQKEAKAAKLQRAQDLQAQLDAGALRASCACCCVHLNALNALVRRWLLPLVCKFRPRAAC